MRPCMEETARLKLLEVTMEQVRWRGVMGALVLMGSALGLLASGCGGGGAADSAGGNGVGDSGGGGGPGAAATGTVTGRVVQALTRAPLAGVTVQAGSGAAARGSTTGADGSYTLTEVPAAGRVVVRMSATGYSESVTTTALAAGATADADTALMPVAHSTSIDPAAGGQVVDAAGVALLSVLPGTLVREDGQAIVGNVGVEVTPIDTAFSPESLPGDYTMVQNGIEVPFSSWGAMVVNLRDSTGARVNLASGQFAQIRIPISTSSSERPSLLALTRLLEDSGLYSVPTRAAVLDEDNSARYYVGRVDHFSGWATAGGGGPACLGVFSYQEVCGVPGSGACTGASTGGGFSTAPIAGAGSCAANEPRRVLLRGCVITPGGTAAGAGVRVRSTGLDHTEVHHADTGTNGCYELVARADGFKTVQAVQGFGVLSNSVPVGEIQGPFPSNLGGGVATASFDVITPVVLLDARRSVVMQLVWQNAEPLGLAVVAPDGTRHWHANSPGSARQNPFIEFDWEDTDGHGPIQATIVRLLVGRYKVGVYHQNSSLDATMQDGTTQLRLRLSGQDLAIVAPSTPFPPFANDWYAFDLDVDTQCRVTLVPRQQWVSEVLSLPAPVGPGLHCTPP